MPLKRTLCNPRFGCGGGGVHDSPTKPYREPRYTLSRLPSLVDARQVVHNSSSNSVIHEAVADTKALSSSDDTHPCYRSAGLDGREHLSSTRMLLHKVHAMLKRQSSAASSLPSLSVRNWRASEGFRNSDSSSMCAHQVPTMISDEEEGWETDDEGEEDVGRRDL
ncbi:hypothetical protein LTR17_016567 [Elasticomyces elasticus]|nr:hypothetical protein LTR17_016567 [Elasticomyces elasticus]